VFGGVGARCAISRPVGSVLCHVVVCYSHATWGLIRGEGEGKSSWVAVGGRSVNFPLSKGAGARPLVSNVDLNVPG
jgi:hypothetical protein